MKKTYNIKLLTSSQEDLASVLEIFKLHQSVYNYMSDFVFVNINKNINKKIIHDKNYYKCRKLFPNCPSQIIIRAKEAVYSNYKTIKSNKQLSKLKKPIKQENLSIRLDKRLYTFIKDNKIKLTTCDRRITCSYVPYPKFKELFSKYSLCDPLIFYKDNQFWLSVSFEIPEPTYIENNCVGVDLGIKRFATTSEGNCYQDKQFLREKRRLRYNKRILRSKLDTKHSHSCKIKINNIKKKERNKNKELCHKVVNSILKTNSNAIVIEDLKGIKSKNKGRKFNNKRSQIPFYKFREILNYKAHLLGKKMITVDPSYTSQNDYRKIEKGIRKGCRYYASDNLIFDADWNAAINIGLRSKLPISFHLPLDGRLNLMGRLQSISQSCKNEFSKKNSEVMQAHEFIRG